MELISILLPRPSEFSEGETVKNVAYWIFVVAAVGFIVAMEFNGAHPFTFEWLR